MQFLYLIESLIFLLITFFIVSFISFGCRNGGEGRPNRLKRLKRLSRLIIVHEKRKFSIQMIFHHISHDNEKRPQMDCCDMIQL